MDCDEKSELFRSTFTKTLPFFDSQIFGNRKFFPRNVDFAAHNYNREQEFRCAISG